jgi:hypothetical protein
MTQLPLIGNEKEGTTNQTPGLGPAQDAEISSRKRGLDTSRPDSIWTSRYHNKAIASSGLVAVRITRMPPRWKLPYTAVGCTELAPTFEMLKAAKLPGGAQVFDTAFEELLAHRDPALIAAKLRGMQDTVPGSKGVVLLCYEDVRVPGTRCHRLQVANWLGKVLGIDIKELPEE